jgi:hypothetical protein
MTSVRPNPAGLKLLNLRDIKPGLRVQRWHRGQKCEIETIVGFPVFGYQTVDSCYRSGNELYVQTEDKWSSRPHYSSLADMGVVPYDHGVWNDVNYTTAISDPEPVSFKCVRSPIVFYERLVRWFKTIDSDSSPYKGATNVTVIIPERLRFIIAEHDAAYYVSTSDIRRDLQVTVHFVHRSHT